MPASRSFSEALRVGTIFFVMVATLAVGCTQRAIRLGDLRGAEAGKSIAVGAEAGRSAQEPKVVVYKELDGEQLQAFIFQPEGALPADRRGAIILIHGGNWRNGEPQQYFPFARYFASRGAVCFCIEYRLAEPGGVSDSAGATVLDSIEDCKSAVRFVRTTARRWGVDPHKIAVFGDSAGAHLAACTGTLLDSGPPLQYPFTGSEPSAMVLISPFIDTTDYARLSKLPGIASAGGAQAAAERERAQVASPYRNIMKQAARTDSGMACPPALLVHGAADQLRIVEDSRNLAEALDDAKVPHSYVVVQGVCHPVWKARDAVQVEVLRACDDFLASLGYLRGERPRLVAK